MGVMSAPETTPQRLSRFELRRMLGQGAQASVWLAFDPHLEREVAVKILRRNGLGTTGDDAQWLHEARSVSRLTHPHIVPVFEADVHDDQPFLVFEYVAGHTLTEVLRAQGAYEPHKAVAIASDILSALQAAHEAGLVHRDLKPSNVLIDAAGRARVMDFGIAVKVNDASHANRVVGTPGYLSPEAALGLSPTPAMDVFAAGLLLAELLAGRRVMVESDANRAVQRAINEDQTLPECTSTDVDDKLRAIVLRAMARDTATRYPSAAAFREALQAWAQPAAAPGTTSAASSSGTLDFLLRRMRHKSDFPALSDAVSRIQRVATSETESLNSLANEILKDVALTNKLLRVVNTASYRHAGGGSISTISRAAALVGFAGIRNMALSLVLLEHMQDKSHANVLKEEFLRSLLAGTLASELSVSGRESEEAFIGSMFQNLGRLLSEFYFPDEARQVRSLLSRGLAPGEAPRAGAEESASVQVLGLSYEALGVGVAKSWGFPDSLQRCMRKPAGDPPTRTPEASAERLRWLAMAANDLTDTLLRADPAEASAALAHTAARYARVLGLTPKHIADVTAQARVKLADSARAMNLSVSSTSRAARLLAPLPGQGHTQTVGEVQIAGTDSLSPHALQAMQAAPTEAFDATIVVPPPAAGPASDILAAGIQDITNSMVEDFKLNEVLRMILETMYRALGFRRVLFCLRDPKTDTLTGRFGLGDSAEAAAALFKVPLKGSTDLFAAVCLKGADTLIRDASTPAMASRLPAWYTKTLNAPSFLLLPLLMKGAPFAMIYADQAEAGGIELAEKELSMLRTLRNQAVMAFKQAS
ncbi:MAG: serine/threonine protein kinase [Burkholderiales bacterium PBB1]|nr:MAG: serine/threonine protein kinase [Burkholderiales bacterium PBB1]